MKRLHRGDKGEALSSLVTKPKLSAIGLMCLMATASGVSYSQEASGQSASELEEIVVTGIRSS